MLEGMNELPAGGQEPPRSPWAEILAAAFFSAAFFWGLRFVPLGVVFCIPAAALPLVRIGFRRGALAALTAVAGGALVSALISLLLRQTLSEAAVEAAALVLTAGVCGLAGAMSRKGRMSPVFLSLCLYGGLGVAAFALFGPSEKGEIEKQFDASAKTWMEAFRQSQADPESLKSMEAAMESAKELSAEYAAGLTATLWILLAAGAFFPGRRGLERQPPAEDFSRLRLPPQVAGAFVCSGAAAAVWRGSPRTLAIDILVPLLALYFLAGLSIIAFFARRWLRMRLLRAGLYVASFFFPISLATAGLGLFDWYFDFRRKAGNPVDGRNE
jgi:hypothetical protein